MWQLVCQRQSGTAAALALKSQPDLLYLCRNRGFLIENETGLVTK